MRARIAGIVVTIITLLTITVGSPAHAQQQEPFLQWLSDFSNQAKKEGVSQKTIARAFLDLSAPDQRVLDKANYQPEFTLTIWDYLDPRVNAFSITRGNKKLKKHQDVLAAIEAQFGISRHILLAIWSMETSYGAVLKHRERFFQVPHALATLGYGDKRRSKFGKSQLMAALQILEAGDISHEEMLGSWAGAMGHTQFIPTSYLAYGVDWDGDGRRDIWHSIPDALATAANLLKKNGWKSGRTWGYEVTSPADPQQYEDQTKTLAQWQELGFKRVSKKSFPRPDDRAELKLLAGPEGPAFLMVKNFFVLKRYNNSDFYGLAVGLLADQLAGHQGMVQPWPRPAGSLNMQQKIELQQLLKKGKFYTGEIDGKLGEASKKGIRAFQQRAKLEVDGQPSLELLKALRKALD